MVLECIFFIIKLDVVVKNVIGEIYVCFEKVGFKVVVVKYKQLLCCEVEGFYVVYCECLFFNVLVEFMIFGLVMIQVLEGENVVLVYCDLLGVINLKEVVVGIICVDFVEFIDVNVVYGLDLVENVVIEIVYFFVVIDVVLC